MPGEHRIQEVRFRPVHRRSAGTGERGEPKPIVVGCPFARNKTAAPALPAGARNPMSAGNQNRAAQRPFPSGRGRGMKGGERRNKAPKFSRRAGTRGLARRRLLQTRSSRKRLTSANQVLYSSHQLRFGTSVPPDPATTLHCRCRVFVCMLHPQ